ncbi:MAG: transketolase [Deltaproteobacteria bacterium]|nr:MAG: transketolase [Deltaproteobacteria bacterium]
MPASSLDTVSINTIRFLSADAVQKANSGHPGLPMGAAAMAYALWTRFLKHSPASPTWPDRDRFVLSAGHGSMLLYSLLHLTGYDLPLEQLQSFRRLGSRTPGHPERNLASGVETTTGPLGQGLGTAVGMAVAEAHLAARFNRPGHTVIDHHTYVLASDGDLMEGVGAEACSLAGHLGLGKLIVLYDDNRVSLAGTTSLCFTEDVGQRCAAYGWHVARVDDGNDLDTVTRAIDQARAERARPSLLLVRTHIGFGAPHKQDTFEVHGAPLGEEELRAAKQKLGWPTEPSFLIPPEALQHFRSAVPRGQELEREWRRKTSAYASAFPDLAAELERRFAGTLPKGWDRDLPGFAADAKGLATRKASESVLQVLAPRLPELAGGSADLNPSTFTWLKGAGDFESPARSSDGVQGAVGGPWGYEGRNLHFGVREHAMGAAVNGMAAHGGFIPYGSTFLIFSDYMRPALRLSALMELGTIWVYTHDSIGLGEDGPTHQPVEHYAALRAIPGLLFIRPCDAAETVCAWKVAIENRHRPTALALTRQNVPVLDRTTYAPADGLARGAYVLNPRVTRPDVVLLATGSEVQHIVAAETLLAKDGIQVRLVSMPCWALFEEQPDDYRDSVLPPSVGARLAVETGVSLGWHRWVGPRGATVTLDRFGASAPAADVMRAFGFTAEQVAERARHLLAR